jgi:peptidyl-tRNA hydrolase, PTH1 family
VCGAFLLLNNQIFYKNKPNMTDNQYIIVGLGNPGAQYAGHRHNVGFMALDVLADVYGASAWQKKFDAELATATIAGAKCHLLKPQTFMNLSGGPVQKAAQFFKINPERIIVLHDELEVAPAHVRVKIAGGAGGHNGLKSIDAAIGQNYWRVRIGIGRPAIKDMVSSYVLHNFEPNDNAWLQPLLKAIAAHMPLMLERKASEFQNKLVPLRPKAPDTKADITE